MTISKDALPQLAATLAAGFIAQRQYNGGVAEAARDMVLVFDSVLGELERRNATAAEGDPVPQSRVKFVDGPGVRP